MDVFLFWYLIVIKVFCSWKYGHFVHQPLVIRLKDKRGKWLFYNRSEMGCRHLIRKERIIPSTKGMNDSARIGSQTLGAQLLKTPIIRKLRFPTRYHF